jgi:hypothetical protein
VQRRGEPGRAVRADVPVVGVGTGHGASSCARPAGPAHVLLNFVITDLGLDYDPDGFRKMAYIFLRL